MCSDGRGLHNIAAVAGVMGLAGDAGFAILARGTDLRNRLHPNESWRYAVRFVPELANTLATSALQ